MTGSGDETQQTDDPYTEPPNSTVDDWHGQEVERDVDAADRAMARAGGDEQAAEAIFEEERPEHTSEQFRVPAEQREGTLTTDDDAGGTGS